MLSGLWQLFQTRGNAASIPSTGARLFFPFGIALLLAEDAAAVFLHVKAGLPGLLLAGTEPRPEIPVKEGDALGLGGSASHLLHEGVVLIGADEQGAGKGVKAVLGGILGRGVKPEGIAGSAAVVPAGQGGKEGPQAVLVHFDEPDADGLKIRPGGIPAGPVFGKGMDVGVIPEGYGLQALFPELLNAGNGARGATNVQQ